MLRFFEPLITRALKKYENSHDVLLHQSILSLLSVLIKFGVCPHLSFSFCLYLYDSIHLFHLFLFSRLISLVWIRSINSWIAYSIKLPPNNLICHTPQNCYPISLISLDYFISCADISPRYIPYRIYIHWSIHIREYLVSLISFCCSLTDSKCGDGKDVDIQRIFIVYMEPQWSIGEIVEQLYPVSLCQYK